MCDVDLTGVVYFYFVVNVSVLLVYIPVVIVSVIVSSGQSDGLAPRSAENLLPLDGLN